jgi:ATP-binding cassette, subfamily F, member 3
MLRLENLSKSYGSRKLFSGVNWQVSGTRCIGLVGPNGVGKSTLLRIIMGEEEADLGAIVRGKETDIGYLPQEVTVDASDPLIEFILQGAEVLLAMEVELQRLLDQISQEGEGAGIDRLNSQYAELQERFRMRGGYVVRSRAREIAVGMGFSTNDFESPLSSFSGGWRMRALLCRLLLRHPDILLLDEPTNHLDLESIEWLEGFLSNYEGATIIVSHDRSFLNKIVQEIAELLPDEMKSFVGSYDAYLKFKKEERERLLKVAESQQKEIERLEVFVDRFRYKASKAVQAQSRLKQIEKLEEARVSVSQERGPSMSFSFPQPPRMGRIVLSARGLKKAFGENVVYTGLDFELERGTRVAFVGPNGAGKTTLLKMLAGVMKPDSGVIERGHNVTIAYFAQHSVEQLDLEAEILIEMQRSSTPETFPQVRNVLGAFGFSGDDVHKRISVLSGGEKTRLALAKLMLTPAGCLLLDEPTNHLDISSREILENALKTFEGSVCLVSHDRTFLNEVSTQVLHVEGGIATPYLGNYDYYHWKRQEKEQAAQLATKAAGQGEPTDSVTNKKDIRRLTAELRKRRTDELKGQQRELENVERKIEQTEQRQAELETLLADPATYQSSDGAKLQREYKELLTKLEELMPRWEKVQAQIDAVDARYKEEEERLRAQDT